VKKYSFDLKSLFLDETAQPFATGPSPSQGDFFVPESDPADHANDTQTLVTSSPMNTNGEWWARQSRPQRRRVSVKASFRVARSDGAETSLCPTRSQYITPKAAVNTKGDWRYVVNLHKAGQTSQLVRTERCATSQCSGLCQIPAGYRSSCSQQYVQKRLVALNSNGDNLYTDTFWFPHCCIFNKKLESLLVVNLGRSLLSILIHD